MRFLKTLAIAAALLFAASPAAQAGNTTLFSSTNGDVTFPLSPPTNAGATPGTLDNTNIGQTTPAAIAGTSGVFNSLTAAGLDQMGSVRVDIGTKTAAATGTTTAAATLNKNAGTVTSAALTTAAAGLYTLTITDSAIAAADQVMATVANVTNTGGAPNITTVTPAAGSLVVVVKNIDAAAAFNGTIAVSFVTFKN